MVESIMTDYDFNPVAMMTPSTWLQPQREAQCVITVTNDEPKH